MTCVRSCLRQQFGGEELLDSYFISFTWLGATGESLISVSCLRWSYWTVGLSVLDDSDGATGQLVYQYLMAQMELLDSLLIRVRWLRWSYWTAGLSALDDFAGTIGQLGGLG